MRAKFDVMVRHAGQDDDDARGAGTDRVHVEDTVGVAEQRQSLLLTLSDALRPLADTGQIQNTAARVLGEHLGAARAMYAEVYGEPGAETGILRGQYHAVWAAMRTPFPERYSYGDYGEQLMARRRRGETIVVTDMATDPRFTATERSAWADAGVQAAITVALVKDGRFVGDFGVQSSTPRTWTPGEIALVEETAERTWAAVERARAEAAVLASEAKYRSLFESIDDGFCIIEIVDDAGGTPTDLRFVEVNRAFERQTGLRGVTGQLLSEIDPGAEPHWLDTYARVARTGQTCRFESHHRDTSRWYDVYAARVDTPAGRHVAVVFRNVTERKQHEQRHTFLLRFADALRAEADEQSIQTRTVAMLGEHLGLDRCWISRVFIEQAFSTVGPEHRRPDLAPMSGVFPLSDYPETMRQLATRPMLVDDAATDERFSETEKALLAQLSLRALLVVPLRKDENQVVWALAVAMGSPRRWTDNERVLLEEVAERAWAATARARAEQALREYEAAEAQRRYERARDVIDAMQRELLPMGLPVLPGAQLAAGYLLADADTAAGGDWFDALPLPGGQVALVVGDVVGHGVAASATMGQLRILLHEQLATTADIPLALNFVNAAAERIAGARAATICVAVLDPDTGDVSYCTAGHPPPLVLSTTGHSRYLTPTGAGPIGISGRFSGEFVGTDKLADSELLLLYTDGILERPGRDLSQSTVELAQITADLAATRVFAHQPQRPVERICTGALELMVGLTGHSDDITLLAVQRVTPPPDFAIRVPARAETLRAVRHQVTTWLAGSGVDRHDAGALLHAVTELVTNVCDHAFIDSPGTHTCDVTITLSPTGHLRAQVSDQGRWREPKPSADRGLGLHMTSHMVDNLRIDHDNNGTTATVTHRASTPARLLTTADLTTRPPANPSPADGPFLVLDQPSAPRPRIRVDGPIDASTADEFDRLTRLAAASGTRSLTVDLTGVTHLASAGVAILHRLLALHHHNDTTLRLYAPIGTPADMILSLVQIPHATYDPDHPADP